MLRFIETIKLLDGQFYNMDYHQQRVNKTLQEFFAPKSNINLKNDLLKNEVPKKGFFKCRVIYGSTIISVEFLPYSIKPIQSLKVIESDLIEYDFKFENREALIALYERRVSGDEVIIVKNKMVTDASYANLVFKRGNEWVTPGTYLLNGTMRQSLLDKGIIKEEAISVSDIRKFEKVKLINSMLGMDGKELDISKVVF
jgi:4-amino-4-deoxychorismate lyase